MFQHCSVSNFFTSMISETRRSARRISGLLGCEIVECGMEASPILDARSRHVV